MTNHNHNNDDPHPPSFTTSHQNQGNSDLDEMLDTITDEEAFGIGHLEDKNGESEQIKKCPQETENQTQALDGGYGWFIVLGCFIAHPIGGGLDRMEGIFFLQYVSRFNQSAQLSAWPGAVVTAVRHFLGPFTSAVCTRYSVRSSVMIGGLLLSLGTILSGLAPNIYFIFFSQSVLCGIGGGLMYAPGLIIVGTYFDKRRSLAAGLATAGIGVGTFFLVPLAQYLFDEYGFFGAFLLIGGITLNLLVVAMLYRPLIMHHLFLQSQKSKTKTTGHHQDEWSASAEQETLSMKEVGHSNPDHDKAMTRHCEKTNISTNRNSSTCTTESRSKEPINKRKTPRNALVSSVKICFPTEHKGKHRGATKKLFHFYLLKNPSFLLYCISIGLFTMASKSAFTFIPALVTSKGHSESEAALVLSITGILDTVGKVGMGFLVGLPSLVPFRPIIYNLIMFTVATTAFIMPSLSTFASFCVLCCLYGITTGAYVSQKSVILVDILGASHLSSSFGILISFQGLGTLVGPPLSGALKDYFGTFDEAFYLGGGSMVVAACLMVASNVFLKRQRRLDNEKKYVNP